MTRHSNRKNPRQVNTYKSKSTDICRIAVLFFLALFMISNTSFAETKPAKTGNSKQDLYLQWSQAYLIDSVFAAEYLAISDHKSAKSKQPQNAAGVTAFLKSEKSLNLWLRASFAIHTARTKGQRLHRMREIKGTLADHQKHLGKYELQKKLSQLLKSEKLDNKKLATVIEKSLSSKTHRSNWNSFNRVFKADAPACELDFKEISKFAAYQKNLAAGGRTPNAPELLSPLKKWKIEEVQCLIFAFMSASPKSQGERGFEPLGILTALRQTDSSVAKNEVIKVNTAIRFLQKGMYAESLRILVDLQEKTSAYRLPYDTVQRIFSIRQRGSGKVAIKGL